MSPETRAELASQRDRARDTVGGLLREADDLTSRAKAKTDHAHSLAVYAADLDVILGDTVQAEVPS